MGTARPHNLRKPKPSSSACCTFAPICRPCRPFVSPDSILSALLLLLLNSQDIPGEYPVKTAHSSTWNSILDIILLGFESGQGTMWLTQAPCCLHKIVMYMFLHGSSEVNVIRDVRPCLFLCHLVVSCFWNGLHFYISPLSVLFIPFFKRSNVFWLSALNVMKCLFLLLIMVWRECINTEPSKTNCSEDRGSSQKTEAFTGNQSPKCCKRIPVPFYIAALHLQGGVTFLLRLSSTSPRLRTGAKSEHLLRFSLSCLVFLYG